MALTLPANFASDIQGSDTALFPVVIIGNTQTADISSPIYPDAGSNIYLSTNVISTSLWLIPDIDGYAFNTLPILLNIPSLKESIDIEKRNYKISSVNLDISNYEYNGKRFSELVGDSSLINTECRIFWYTQNVGNIILSDAHEYYTDSAFQIYNGTIRRYEHDTEKVRLVVEDRSQATLHRDLPTAELGFGADVPSKYQGVKIPMVYGAVDRSPLVRYSGGGQWTLKADSIKPINIADNISDEYNIGNYDQLYLFSDDSYISIIKDNQFLINSLDNTIQVLLPVPIDPEEYEDENDILDCYYYLKPTSFDIYEGLLEGAVIEQGTATSLLEGIPDPSIFFDNDLSTSHTFNVETNQTNSGTNDEYHWVIKVPVIPTEITYLELLSYDIAINGIVLFPDAADGEVSLFYKRQANDDTGNQAIEDAGLGGLIAFGTDVFGVDLGGIADTADIVFDSSAYDNLDSFVNPIDKRFIIYKKFDPPTFVIIASSGGGHFSSGQDFTEMSYITIKDLIVRPKIKIEKVFQYDFYANVIGRKDSEGTIPTAAETRSYQAIHHIMHHELGVPVDDLHSPPEQITYNDWHYAFTVDKKINSKKLIEGIASASPYISRFNNMGAFSIGVIKPTYVENDLTVAGGNETIKEADVISYSFSRTKIEDVKTKVEFKYNWDYARGEFNSSTTKQVVDSWEGFDYYGLNSNHSESTLIIDSEQGKYIRDHDTAKAFAEWILLWSTNQHLIIKLKLPLKYMNLEIGDIIEFEKVLGGVDPYGIDYTANGTPTLNGQDIFPYFMITSTNKTLEFCELECIMMHSLESTTLFLHETITLVQASLGFQDYLVTATELADGYYLIGADLLEGGGEPNVLTTIPFQALFRIYDESVIYYDAGQDLWTSVNNETGDATPFRIIAGQEYMIRLEPGNGEIITNLFYLTP